MMGHAPVGRLHGEVAAAPDRTANRMAVALVIGIAVFAALVRIPRLGTPSQMIFDEIYYARAAQQILAGVEVTEERTHPPLSKVIIAAGIGLAGNTAFGWRIASALAGVALVLTVYWLAMVLFDNRLVAVIAAALTALDGLVFVESRIAKPDIFLTLFLFGAYAALWRYLRVRLEGGGGGGTSWLYIAGVAAGCAVATKWTTVVPLSVIVVTFALLLGWGRISLSRRDVARVALAFVVIPAAIYLVSYVPYFSLGHSVREFVAQQASMYDFHASLTEGHPYQSKWWSWPLLLRPIWYEYYEVAPGIVRGIVAIGNPIIWWSALPAMAAVAVAAVRTRRMPEVFVLTGFLISYVQFAFISRPLFLYHYLPAVPFLVLALAWTLARVRARAGYGPVLVVLVLAAGWFVALYPALSALPIASDQLNRLMWFGSWI